jgi:zinc transport system substrate-binding protein
LKKIIAMAALLLGAASFVSCTASTESYSIYSTIYPLVYVINRLAEGTDVTAGVVPGITSHESTADWSPKEIIAMTNASLIFYVGANLDPYIDNQIDGIFETLNEEGRLVKMQDEITFIEGLVHSHDEAEGDTTTEEEEEVTLGFDPHFWVSPIRMIEAADVVLEKLSWAYPDDADTFAANCATLIEALESLSQSYSDTIEAGTKIMMTSTNLYGYLAADYGLEILPISPGYHEETEQFTAQQKQEIVDEAILHGIRYILFEKNSSSPLSEAVLAALNSSSELTYTVGQVDYDIMHTVPSTDADYIQIMLANLQSIATATAIPDIDTTSR